MYFLDRRIILITGKGGVGRTTVSVALARAAARLGKKTLLLEVGDSAGGPSGTGVFFGLEHLSPEPRPLTTNLSIAHLWARAGHELFLQSVLPGKALIRAALRSKAVGRFLLAAPSLHEMGLFYHLLTFLREPDDGGTSNHDLIVIDMPATGHTLALTGLPEILLNLMPRGPVARALREGQGYLNDAERGEAWVVTLPEKLPVTEGIELVEGLRETGISPGGFILNRVLPNPFTEAELSILEDVVPRAGFHGELALERIRNASASLIRLIDETQLPVVELFQALDDPIEALTEHLLAQMGAQ